MPVQDGRDRRRAPEAGSIHWLHLAGHGPRRAVVVAVTNGRQDLGTWEQIFRAEFYGWRKRLLVEPQARRTGTVFL
jgi:hypothetical protein